MRDSSQMSAHAAPDRPTCPHCSEPIGVYEPVWRFAPHLGAERTSLLNVRASLRPLDSLWHVACAEVAGIDGG